MQKTQLKYALCRQIQRIILVVIATFLCGGCDGTKVAAPVNPQIAKQTLQQVLESWKRGETAESWSSKTPKVVVQDFDWTAGKKLVDFEIVGEGEARDANLYCAVKLVFDGANKQQQSVKYVVGTDPVITVFRDMLN